MALFAIGDTHLSIGGSKPMTVFTGWERYTERLEENWRPAGATGGYRGDPRRYLMGNEP